MANDLRKAQSVAISGPNTLVIRVSEQYNSIGAAAADPSRWSRVEPLLSQVVGQDCTIRVETAPNDPADGKGEPGVSVAPAAAAPGARQIRDKVRQLPQVQRARDVLGAEILSVDPDFGEAPAASPQTAPEDDGPGEPSEED
jgi:hypothetical protein